MLLTDTHIHSTVSFDGHNTRTEMAQAAMKKGIQTLCFTDHYDVVNEKNELVPRYDWTPARREHQAALSAVGRDMELLYGLELGNAPACWEGAEAALQEPGLDFVLGSIHNASTALNWQDYYYVSFDTPELCCAYLDDYFDQLEQLMAWGNFDSLAHLPYPLRYMRDRDAQAVDLHRYDDRIDALLRSLVETGKALEVNSAKKLPLMPEYRWLLERFRALGGELVTVGCDAHRVSDVGVGLVEATALVQACGFSYLTVFRGRKPCPVKL